MQRMSINATDYRGNEAQMREYLDRNCMTGCFLSKDGFYQVYEATSPTTGYLAGEFTYKRDALAFITDWRNLTGLPRFNNVRC